MSTTSTTREPRGPPRKPPSPDAARRARAVLELQVAAAVLERRRGGRQLRLEVERLQHRHGHVLGGRDRGRLPAAAGLDRVQARRGELHELELAALGQQHRGLVGAGVEVQRSGVDPAHRGGRGHAERAQHRVGAGLGELGLGGSGRRQVEAQAIVAARAPRRRRRPPRRCRPRGGCASRPRRRCPRSAATARTAGPARRGSGAPRASRRPASRCR